jgi:outer membrane protein OmpA-like peptidoglycan-associated protein
MRKRRAVGTLIAVLVGGPTWAGQPAADVKGSKDHPALLRFAGSTITLYEEKRFDEYELLLGPVPDHAIWRDKSSAEKPAQALEGKVTRIIYTLPVGVTAVEAMRNYADSMKQNAFVEVYTCAKGDCGRDFITAINQPRNWELGIGSAGDKQRYLAAKLERPEQGDLYANVYVAEKGDANMPTIVQVVVVELKPMAASMVKVEATEMASGLATTGKIALYGIYFDFDKADIKPESDETLAEIAKLLKGDPNLKLYVIGHTDNKGTAAYNVDLSQRRAAAVVQRLVAGNGIDAARLAPAGVGPYAPVASNKTEAGQAKNRRVELVER